MKRGITYFLSLLIVCLLYFTFLYFFSNNTSLRNCVNYVNEKSDLFTSVNENDLVNQQEEFVIKEEDIIVKDKGEQAIDIKENNKQEEIYDVIIKNEQEYKEQEETSNAIIKEEQEHVAKNNDSQCDTINNKIDQVKKEKAVIVILVRNNEIGPMRRTLRQFEDRFNRRFNYDYVFLNDEPFTEEFKSSISALTNAKIKFGLVPQNMWSVPEHVNQTIMHQQLQDYASRNIMYGGSLSYRHMCRFNSGFFYRHPLLKEYDYYWRVEPGVSFFCDIDYDPFTFMRENGKEYGFTITLKEIPETIPTLWDHTIQFAHKHELNTTLLKFFGDPSGGYNLCHYWSNFEIANLNLWRDKKYQDYFDYLDSTGNFFYERWGDAIVHSLAAGLFLNKSQVHFFNNIGYQHDNFAHCVDDGIFGKCMCPENVPNFDNQWGSCLSLWQDYREEGHQWSFKKNGEQHLENGQIFKKDLH